MRSRTAILCSSGPPRSRALVTPDDQELLGGSRHDHGLELREVGLVPVAVVGVPDDHGVDVHVPEPWEHGHAFGGNDFGAGGDRERPDLTDRGDGLAFDEDDAVADGWAGEAVDERAADEGFRLAGRPGRLRRQGHADKDRDSDRTQAFHGADATRTALGNPGGRESSIRRSAVDNRQSVTSAICTRQSAIKKPAAFSSGGRRIIPAVTYSPTQLPTQYHRR